MSDVVQKANFEYLAALNAAEKAREERDRVILEAVESGATLTGLAKRLGMSRQRVGQIVKGEADG